jgi:hypothetical protein
MAGKRGEGERLDKFASRGGHDHMDFKGLALKGADQFRRFVRGNSTGDTDRDSHGLIVERFDWGRPLDTYRVGISEPPGTRICGTDLPGWRDVPFEN